MSNNRSETVDKSSEIPKLTRKQKAFADELLADKKISATEAVRRTYNVSTTGSSARAVASELLTKPSIIRYLDQNTDKAENTILEVMEVSKKYAKEGGKEGASYASVAVSSANSLLDRVFGKATQKVVTENSSVNVIVTLK